MIKNAHCLTGREFHFQMTEKLWLPFIYHIVESEGQLQETSFEEGELKIYFFKKVFETLKSKAFYNIHFKESLL